MIISDRHEFVFVHIPKCAGTSVRKALRPIDETIGIFDRIADHPDMGRVNYGHLTLSDLSAYFPDQYAKVAAYRSIAIVRHPVDRFLSALFQRLREFKGYNQSEITAAVIGDESRVLTRYLQSQTGRLGLEYVHFNRQSDYVFKDDVRIVRRIFAIDRLAEASMFIEGCTGVSLLVDAPENRTVVLQVGALTPLVRLLRKPYAAIAPLAMRDRVRKAMERVGAYTGIQKQQFLSIDSELERFLTSYYKRDFELYAHALRP